MTTVEQPHTPRWVRTLRHGHHGLALTTYPDCPENSIWQEAQKGITEEQFTQPWVLLLTAAGNSYTVPESDCVEAEPIPFDQWPDRVTVELFGSTAEEMSQTVESIEGISPPGQADINLWINVDRAVQ